MERVHRECRWRTSTHWQVHKIKMIAKNGQFPVKIQRVPGLGDIPGHKRADEMARVLLPTEDPHTAFFVKDDEDEWADLVQNKTTERKKKDYSILYLRKTTLYLQATPSGPVAAALAGMTLGEGSNPAQ